MSLITTGIAGGRWRASITPWGAVEPRDGSPTIDWHIAADDRWHSPRAETTVRQRRLDGTAVVETRVRVPDGDAVQRVYSVADHGGLTLIEVENESPLPIAVAFTGGGLLALRPPAAPIVGIDLDDDAIAFPIGHRATLTVAIAHDADLVKSLPQGMVPSRAAEVARGWKTVVDVAGRMALPDDSWNQRLVAARCELVLDGAPMVASDPEEYLLAVDQLVRMGESAKSWVPDVAYAIELLARSPRADWLTTAALDAADRILAAAQENRARADLAAIRRRLAHGGVPHDIEPDGLGRWMAWIERRLVTPLHHSAAILPTGFPAAWMGQNFEVFELPTGATGTVSFAVRWHGARPALIWEQQAGTDGPVLLQSPILAPGWQSTDSIGEALWPAPVVAFPADVETISFG